MDLTKEELVDLIAKTRIETMNQLVSSVLNVQPMDPTIMAQLHAAGKSEKELMREGYTPVSHLKLLWTKKG